MNTQTSNTGFMPRSIAITLLTNRYSKTNGFKKRCLRATERVCEPVSRSTLLSVSAPKTGQQKLQRRLAKATAKQLLTWSRRTLRRGNKLQDQRDTVPFRAELDAEAKEKLTDLLDKQIAAHNALGEAISAELTARSTRGMGYRKPVKFKVEKIKLIIV